MVDHHFLTTIWENIVGSLFPSIEESQVQEEGIIVL